MRRYNDNSDYMSREMDAELGQLEEILTALYANATNEITEQFTEYSKKIKTKLKAWRELLEQGLITETDYQAMVRNKILNDLRQG